MVKKIGGVGNDNDKPVVVEVAGLIVTLTWWLGREGRIKQKKRKIIILFLLMIILKSNKII